MFERLSQKRQEEGFTLVELLIVIVILGILAAVVVFAVGGISDRGTKSACKSDLKSVEVAVETYYAKTPTSPKYPDGTTSAARLDTLVAAKLLKAPPSTTNGYTIAITDTNGTVTGDLDGTPATTDCSA
ncbi:MAG: prepilin-type N-terminal cleavage/methylation domain-containing protein [Actinomycetota bacterium]|nr:prepilin-type N-terminal cleavage/methylation domain-containing protein [Actinomycetota bacterium]